MYVTGVTATATERMNIVSAKRFSKPESSTGSLPQNDPASKVAT